MKLPKDLLSGIYTKPRIFLCEVDKERICQLETTNTSATLKFNSYSELSFEVGRTYNNLVTGETLVNPYYDKIEAVRLIEVEKFGYFEIQGPELISDGIKEAKNITAYSLEYTLSTKYLNNFLVNTGTAGSVEVTYAESLGDINNIQPVTLYNPSNEALSLLHIALKEVYGWKIKHVDVALQTLSRSFEIDRESVYDFLMNEVCEKFNCYIVFDTMDNTISVYAESLTAKFIGDGNVNTFIISPPFSQIGTVSVNGYKSTRWEYNASTGSLTLEETPVAGAHIEVVDGALTEWETDVFVSFDNLSQEINVNYDADAIKTRLTVTYGDDGDIRETNLGLPYLTDISYYYTVDWMGQDLYDAYTAYMQKSNESQSAYTNNSQEILKLNDQIYYEENRLSLEYSLVQSVGPTTVGTYYVRQENFDGSFYYKEVSLPSEYDANENYYSNVTVNVTEEKVDNLYAVFKKYFNNENEDDYSGDTDITSWKTDLDKLESDFEFMETCTLSHLSSEMSKVTTDRIGNYTVETTIKNFLSEMWGELGRTPLQKLYLEPYQTVKETNIKAGWSQKDNKNYGYYYPVLLYIETIDATIAYRNSIIKKYENQRNVFYSANSEISNGLLMDQNFTEPQLIRLSAFIREDELHIDDIVETSQDDLSSSFKIKQDAMESGRIELQKLCQPQLQFSMTMANIYALPEFEPIINQFQLGKVIKVALRPDYIKQSRLMQVNINFDDFSDFSCEFGELTSLRSQSDIHADLLRNAITAGKSVATNSSYWSRGSDTASSVDLKIQQGLLDATTQIKATDGHQGVVIDKYGIHLRAIDPVTGETDPKQGWIVNNQFLYSDDGFKSTKAVFGEYTYDDNTYYGILAEALVGRLLIGSQIKLENNNATMTFDNNGLSVANTTNSFNVNPNNSTLLSISRGAEKIFYVDDSGVLHISGDGSGLDISANDSISGLSSSLTILSDGISSKVSKGEVISSINQSAEAISINASKISLEGKVTANGSFEIDTDGSMHVIGGTVGGWSIADKSLYYADGDKYNYSTSPIGIGVRDPNWAFWAGYDENSTDDEKAKFRVTQGGYLYSSHGKIGGWTVQDTRLVSTNDSSNYTVCLSDYNNDSESSRIFSCTYGDDISSGESDTMSIRRNGEIRVGLNASNQVRIQEGHIDFYYNNVKTGRLGQTSNNLITVEGTSLYCEHEVYLTKSKYMRCHYVNDNESVDDLIVVGVSGGKNVVLGGEYNDANTNIHTSSGHFINFYNNLVKVGYFNDQGLVLPNNYGIQLNGDKFAFRYYDSAVYTGIDTEPLKLVGSSITANGTAVTSDERKKNTIKSLDDKYNCLFDALSAKTYKFNDYRQGVTNCGFIAQELLSALSNVGLTANDFGAFVDVYGDSREYAIDYTQFIPIMWEEIKFLRARVLELENKD